MKTCVTGAAGFIGSSLAAELLRQGHSVVGIDALTDYYDPAAKRRNLADLITSPAFQLCEMDLQEAPLHLAFKDVDAVFHLAGQPGVRGSWADGFAPYLAHNVMATQQVLEAAAAVGVPRLVYASSSSVYGNAARYPCREDDVPSPHSPYGVTKLAGEHLVRLYASNRDLSTVSLRYFTVFGPRQRPEMAMAQIIESAVTGQPFVLFAAPGTLRDFTFVDDVVTATIAAATQPVEPGSVFNVAGGSPTTMGEVIDLVGQLVGSPVMVDRRPSVAGDVVRTGGDGSLARMQLDWCPAVSLYDGLASQVDWRLRQTPSLPTLPRQYRHPHVQPRVTTAGEQDLPAGSASSMTGASNEV